MKKFIMALILILIVILILIIMLVAACTDLETNKEIIANDGRSIYAVDIYDLEELVYDTNTQIVYIRQATYSGCFIYTLYLSENGFPYRYVNGELVEIGK